MAPSRRSSRLAKNAAATATTTEEDSSVKKKEVATKKLAPKKAAATKAKAKKAPAAASKKIVASSATASSKKVVVVEACKQWGAFKTRANKIAKLVGDRALVEINKEKPGKGNFVVSIKGIDKPIVCLLGMKRPFPALKALDIDEIGGKILAALE